MQIQCPKCSSYKVTTDRQTTVAAGVGLLIIGGLLSFLLFPIVFAAIGILLLIVAAFTKAKKATCGNCKYKWDLQKK